MTVSEIRELLEVEDPKTKIYYSDNGILKEILFYESALSKRARGVVLRSKLN